MTDALPADRALNRDELDALACEWSDFRKAYEGEHTAAEHIAFSAGWTARHLHGYRPDPQATMMSADERQAHRDERSAAIDIVIESIPPRTGLGRGTDLRAALGHAYDLGITRAQVKPEPPESDEPEAENDGRVEYGPAPAKRTLSEALLALEALADEFASAMHVASLDVAEHDTDGSAELLRDTLGREALHDERQNHGSHVIYPITRIFARAVIERLLVDTPVVLDIRPEVAP